MRVGSSKVIGQTGQEQGELGSEQTECPRVQYVSSRAAGNSME